jgi:hypothetical protein
MLYAFLFFSRHITHPESFVVLDLLTLKHLIKDANYEILHYVDWFIITLFSLKNTNPDTMFKQRCLKVSGENCIRLVSSTRLKETSVLYLIRCELLSAYKGLYLMGLDQYVYDNTTHSSALSIYQHWFHSSHANLLSGVRRATAIGRWQREKVSVHFIFCHKKRQWKHKTIHICTWLYIDPTRYDKKKATRKAKVYSLFSVNVDPHKSLPTPEKFPARWHQI